nr:nitrogenase component 1 [Geotalea toluenoxydans]
MANNLGLAVKPVTETPESEVKRVAEWINTEEYKEKNFARQALVINPAHACQPLGAELAAHGFEGSLPFVHGSQGCASYYRSTSTATSVSLPRCLRLHDRGRRGVRRPKQPP